MTAIAIGPTGWRSRSAATTVVLRTRCKRRLSRSGAASASYHAQRGTVAASLLTVVRYRAIDLERQHAKHATRRASDDQLRDHPASDDVSQQVINREVAERLHASLALLPDAQQEVITLAFYGQLTHTEIATQLGIPPGTVKGRMRLSLRKLHASHQAA